MPFFRLFASMGGKGHLQIVTSTGYHYPWAMTFFVASNEGKSEVEHYCDLLLRVRLEEYLPQLKLADDEAQRLRGTVSKVAEFFGQAAKDGHSVVIVLNR